MTKRVTVLAIAGISLLAAYVGRSVLLRGMRVEVQAHKDSDVSDSDSSGEPQVIFGGYNGTLRLEDAIRIDVRGGVPHMRAGVETPIADLQSFLEAEVKSTKANCIVVTASREEKIGDVVAGIDVCRKARVRGVILNPFLDEFARRR